MSNSSETLVSNSGETLWPVETLDGWRLLRAVDSAVVTLRESDREYREQWALERFPDRDIDSDPVRIIAVN